MSKKNTLGMAAAAAGALIAAPQVSAAASFAELLDPIPNAAERLAQADADAPPQLIQAQYGREYHHHHHRVYIPPRHHHHHHHMGSRGGTRYGGPYGGRVERHHHHHMGRTGRTGGGGSYGRRITDGKGGT
jgi:hypothetical protein